MPKSKNYLTYPEPFHDLIRQAVVREVRVPCDSANQARTLRGHLYGFFGALKKGVAEKDCPQDIRELYNMTTKVTLMCDEALLIALPRDQSAVAKLVGDALRNQPDAAPTAGGAFQPSPELLEAAKKAEEYNRRE